ncbi:putative chitobiose transport system substrate-binding protein [Pseudoduganella lurida]|uniref:Putative chitobiose transport system substrate-binding protein n=1 Tax=Pseudoduganella lurida TaxID=1036180 RepID=A0A562R8E8_9BURK|nr:sugar ABC transporter substrate-binding protein [Pseudoduganella lurida]TWI65315.1 putative chitobiose transport system substrate-binding protein [Pseudoduganella lurida]
MNLVRMLTVLAAAAIGFSAVAAPARIEFWTFSMKPKFTPYFDGVVKRYEAANPGVKVEWIDFPWDIIQTKLVTRIVAGTPPALVNLNVPWADEFARDGLLQPVDSLLERPRYLQGALDDLTFGGKTYGFPLYSNVAVIAYNTQLFKAAGIPHPPRSLDEQLAFARQIARRTGKAGLCPALAKIDGLMMQQGLDVIRNGRAVFNSPAHVALIRKLADTYKAGGLLKDSLFAEDNFPAAIDAYKGGRLGMLLAPPTAVRRIELDAKDVYAVTDVAPAPLGPTGIADGGWLIHFAVPAGVPRALLPEVGKFARFLTNDANQLAFARQASVYPAATLASRDPFFLNVPPGAAAAEKAVAAGAVSMPHSRTMYVAGITDYDELRRSLVKAVEAGVTGRQDIARALDTAVAIWNRKLAKQFPHTAQPVSTSGSVTKSDTSSASITDELVSTLVTDPDVDTNSAVELVGR